VIALSYFKYPGIAIRKQHGFFYTYEHAEIINIAINYFA